MGVEAEFYEHYVDELERRTAALFVGAGLSKAAGFPDWSTLLSGVAGEIELDAKQEHDLPAVAQFYLNRYGGGRGRIAQLVCNTFLRRTAIPENQRILARLPVERVWTTNYDELLERAWELHAKRMDVKSRNADLTTSRPDADAVLYKMHGTAGQPDEIVLSKDDYELYARSRPGFLQLLGGDLITRTFLFLGLSFTDPNLGHVMATLRSSFQSAPRQHYTIMKRPSEAYAARRFQHFIDDLHRYGVRTLAVDDFADITRVLEQLERRYAQKNVFVSGSYPEDGEEVCDAEERRFIGRVSRGVGRVIARRGLNLVSGFGRVVGSGAVSGVIDELYNLPYAGLSRRLIIRPIRDVRPENMALDDFKRRYREDMISQSGIVIVIGGLRRGVVAPGVLQEFEFAAAQGKVVLPIAATGHAARQVYERMVAAPDKHLSAGVTVDLLHKLGPETASEEGILAAVDECLAAIQGRRV